MCISTSSLPAPWVPADSVVTVGLMKGIRIGHELCYSRTPSNTREGRDMKIVLVTAATAFAFIAGIAVADAVRDWHDLDKVHDHVVEAIHEMDRARAANHYDMAGHGAKAEQALHVAERELHEAVEASKAAH